MEGAPGSGLHWLVALCCASASAAAAGEPSVPERGRRLFVGELPLTARVTGHAAALPPQAARCMNCHAVGSAGPAAPASDATRSFGPVLGSALLTQAVARRGGPPSRYDEAAFCRLLATGIDPADVIIPREMPRYEVSAADCRALWAHLSAPRR